MKTPILLFCAAFAAVVSAQQLAPPAVGAGVALVPIDQVVKPAPVFFAAEARAEARIGYDAVETRMDILFRVQQGKPEVFTLGLQGDGRVLAVKGDGVRGWAVRTEADGSRMLDVHLLEAKAERKEWKVEVLTRDELKDHRQKAALMLPGPGKAGGFSLDVSLVPAADVEMRLLEVKGMLAAEGSKSRRFQGAQSPSLIVAVEHGGSAPRELELVNASLAGTAKIEGDHVALRLTGELRATKAGAVAELLRGRIALAGATSGDGWHVRVRRERENYLYELVATRAGNFPLALALDAPVVRKGDWRGVDFMLPAGVVVPLTIDGLGDKVSFDRTAVISPERKDALWSGYLPAAGRAQFAWKAAREDSEGALFYSSTETSDVSVSSGLLRQTTHLQGRVLQGKLRELQLKLDGPGEILAVTGDAVVSWAVREANGARFLDLKFSQPIEGVGQWRIEAQQALGTFPQKITPMRITPEGALRHSGWLRVTNKGAVKIEVANAQGLLQLAPAQFPGAAMEGARQVLVYRFPAAQRGFEITAEQVLPEVSLNEITQYELAESDRRIAADLELDIREAPLREWELLIPGSYAVTAVAGAQVADYAVASEEREGKRVLKVVFNDAVSGRVLISVRLERNQAAQAGRWELNPLGFPGVKSRRGFVGVQSVAGFRIVPEQTKGLAEVPLTFFPKRSGALQQAFRIRDGEWSAALKIEAIGQNVHADVFHLYSLKPGAASASVLLNYFVVGAPANEWRISLPPNIGNLDVTGQNVGRDWRREENVLIVPLTRPVIGNGTLLLTFEQTMSARGGELAPGAVRPLNVQGERGFVQVVSPLQVNYEVARSEGALLPIDASELPAEFRVLTSAPTLAAWQYTARDFGIALNVRWFDAGETAEQVIDDLKLSSQVARDGQWVTDARFFVKSKSRGALRLKLPEGVRLWEVRADKELVNARADGGEILIPLPAKSDPNAPVEVAMRYGAQAPRAGKPVLTAPVLAAPVVIGAWTVRGDEGRQLVPAGGNALLVRPVLRATGLEWIANRGRYMALLLVGLLGVAVLLKRGVIAWLAGCAGGVLALMLAWQAWRGPEVNRAVLEYAAPVVAANRPVEVVLRNVPDWLAFLHPFGACLVLAGAALGGWAALRGKRPLVFTALAVVLLGALAQHGGAVACFALIGLAVLALVFKSTPGWLRQRRARRVSAAAVAASTAMWMILAAPVSRADENAVLNATPAESIVQQWTIADGRAQAELEIRARLEAGERVFLLAGHAVLTSFQGDAGWRVGKTDDGYWLTAERAGEFSGKATFAMPLAEPQKGWRLPTGAAAMQRVTLRWNDAGWEFASPAAANVERLEVDAKTSAATLTLQPAANAAIVVRPRQDQRATEAPVFVAEVSNLLQPGPGVVNGWHRVSVRPTQGRISELVMKVPAGSIVGEVGDGPVGTWRFDPRANELRVAIEPAQQSGFAFTVATQRIAAALPVDLELAPLRVQGAANEVGKFALNFGDDAQAEAVTPKGMSRIDSGDFDASFATQGKEAHVLMQHVFRYGAEEASVALRVAPVATELRAESSQTLSLGEDRVLFAEDLAVTISRAGVFRLDLEIPDGYEIESASGAALSHWSETNDGGKRVLVLHLNGRTLGRQEFAIALTSAAPGKQASWNVPRVSLRGAARESGTLVVVPERGLQVRAVNRSNVSQLDPRELTQTKHARDAAQPGALAFRLLQSDWSLALGIAKLDAWITAQALHEVTLREGQVLHQVSLQYRIENAAVKSLRVRIPGINANAAATVRASGPAVSDISPVAGENGLWELKLQRGVVGETPVQIEYQSQAVSGGEETITPLALDGVAQVSYFTALRTAGRLEIAVAAAPRGWQRADWAQVKAAMPQSSAVQPLMVFRVAEAEAPLKVALKRHDLVAALKLRVTEGNLTTIIAPNGNALTAVDLKVQVAGKSTLRLRLPDGANLFNVLVNGEGVPLSREGAEWLFYVFPAPDPKQPAEVHFVYGVTDGKGLRLEGPALNVPLENLSWRVRLPEGWRLADHGGDFDLQHQQRHAANGEEYASRIGRVREAQAKEAVALLDQANAWLAKGEQEKASQALSKASKTNALDEASNEDARIQLRQLRTQQAVLGLNTRRQKLYLDNRAEGATNFNGQLEQAANANPLLQGNTNYMPQQYDSLLEGNTLEENAALKAIAGCIVAQQLSAEPAPSAIDPALPSRGTVLTFTRSMQVDGNKPLALELKLKRERSGGWLAGAAFAAVMALAAAAARRGR